jgi:hypothetical protein
MLQRKLLGLKEQNPDVLAAVARQMSLRKVAERCSHFRTERIT